VRSIEVASDEIAGDAPERGTGADVTRATVAAALAMEEGSTRATGERADDRHEGATRQSALRGSVRLGLRDDRERHRQEHGRKDAESAHDGGGGDGGFCGK
jgi:hypothetical protein